MPVAYMCGSFAAEQYDLYALGVLDDPEANEIREHLRHSCVTCKEGVREGLKRVTEMALFVPAVSAPRSLRRQIVHSVRGARSAGWGAFELRSPLMPALAAALCLAVGWGAGWFGSERSNRESAGVIVARVSPPPAPTIEIPASSVPKTVSPVSRPIQSNAPLPATPPAAPPDTADLALLQAQLRDRDQQILDLNTRFLQIKAKYDSAVRDLQSAHATASQLAAYQTRTEELGRQLAVYKSAVQVHPDAGDQVLAALSSPSVKLVDLQTTESGQGSSARAILDPDGKGWLVATQLPALPAGRTYQLWLMRRKSPAIVSGGVFKPDASHRAALQVTDPGMAKDLTGLAVTEEPEGGSPLPTGHKILVGLSRS